MPIVEPKIVSCFHQIRCRFAGGFGPVVAPQTAIRPPARAAASEVAQVASPTCSRTTSTPLPVASFTARRTSPVAWLTVASAPSSRARSSFSSLEEVTSALAPSALAIASPAVPTPLPIPQSSTHSPSCSCAFVTSSR